MKKLLILVVVLALALSFTSCAQLDRLKGIDLPPLPTVTERPAATEKPETDPAAPAETEAPVVVVETGKSDADAMRQSVVVNFRKTVMEEYDPAEGTQRILLFSYVTPHVTMPGREAAADAINEYIAMLDETYVTGNDYGDGPSDGYNGLLEQALDNFTYVHETGAGLALEYSSERTANVARADGRVLSLVTNTSSSTGGAHGIYVESAYVFDTETGALLTLDKLTPDYAAFSTLVVQKMVEQAHSNQELYDAISSFVEESEWERSFAHLLREGSWYLNENGLVLFSTLYELAPYAAGIQTFTVSYADLGELLYERWRVGEKQGEGGMEAQFLSDVAEGSFPIFDFVQIDANGQQLCLRSGARIYDVRLQRAEYMDWNNSFALGETFWFCSCMENAGVQLVAELPEILPTLAGSYRTGAGELHRALLIQSGEDGHLILQEEGFGFYEH